MQGEAGAVKFADANVPSLQHRFATLIGENSQGAGLRVAADHHAHDVGLGQAGRRPRADKAAIAQDGNLVGDLEHLLQFVEHKEHRDPVGLDAGEELRAPVSPFHGG